jgi:NAD(P)-dependent dehydrogenase (short-subunit alcohol dehydrogenase family)
MTFTAIPDRFSGKTAIVTGAGAGIGRATAVRLATEGARVVASDVSQQRLDELVAEFPSLALTAVQGDVTSDETLETLLAAAGGTVDLLANVAGVMDNFLPLAEVDDATWDRVFAINVTALMRLTRAVLPGMLEAGAGSIVNVSSEAGLRGGAAGVAYTASKHAVIGMTRSTAVMYAPKGIRINTVAPGAVQTKIEANFVSAWSAERLGPLMAIIPPVAQPDELAATIAWLLSDDASNMTGAVVACDGGWSAI